MYPAQSIDWIVEKLRSDNVSNVYTEPVQVRCRLLRALVVLGRPPDRREGEIF